MNTQEQTSSDLASLLAGVRADHDTDGDPYRVPVSRPELYARLARRVIGLARSNLTESPTKRDAAFVSTQYEGVWTPNNREFAAHEDANRGFFLVRGRPVYVNGWFIIKRYVDLIVQALDRLEVQSVLEVGAGRGKNLALIALQRPNLKLTGIELTSAGYANSRQFADDPPEQLLRTAGFTGTTAEAKERLGKIEFHQGNALDMAFSDKSFDASFTSLVLEQLPRDFSRTLTEMRRVTRRFCVFNEAFREANTWWGRVNLRRLDYFNASTKEFAHYGLEPIYFTTALPQKLTFGTGLLVTRVVG
jgi:ubiquinone/menaquinone biosynthesis C-methylase UbiE